MGSLYLLLIGFMFWPVIRSFAEFVIAVRDKKPGKVAPMIDAAGWFVLAMTCLFGAAVCMERQEPLLAVAFTSLAMARIARPRLSAAATLTRAKLAAIQKD